MPSASNLPAADRDRLALLHRAAFANPFSRERDRLDARLAGSAAETVDLGPLLDAVTALMNSLERRHRATLSAFPEPEQNAARSAFLFDVFHRFLGPLDDAIRAQLRVPEGDPVPAPFARPILETLAARGFAADDAERYLAVFFQMRRAFFFIRERITGSCDAVRDLRVRLWNNLFTVDSSRYDRWLLQRMEQFSTLIVGETGTGKGTAAFVLGSSGFIPWDAKRGRFAENFGRCFLAMNLGQFAESLLESELFGHRKGAFTGAVEAHEGLFARCSPHGVLFLDEIGELSPHVQQKLLKVLEERTFLPVGGHEPRRFSGRLLAATNLPLDAMRREGRFRDDLYYRLSTDVISIPPLRDRLAENPVELGLLVTSVVRGIVENADDALVAEVREAIELNPGPGYPWPGNVRELQQAVRRVLLAGHYVPDPVSPAAPDAPGSGDPFLHSVARGSLDADALLSGYARRLHLRLGSYRAVADHLGVDQRTARRWIGPAQ